MIKRKRDIPEFLDLFETFTAWDGEKYYLAIDTINPKGTLTIMKYPCGLFSYHRKNELYWDLTEIRVGNDDLQDIVWGFRKKINESIQEKLVKI